MNKRILPLLLLAAVISCWIPSSYQIFDSKKVSFPLSNNPEESTAIILKGKSLMISNLPDTENFNYVLLKLVGDQETITTKKCRNVEKKEYDVKFSLRDVPNGSYYLEVYSAPEKYTAYFGYIHSKTLRIQVNDFSVDFIEPLTLAKNQSVFAANQQDSTTLAYYVKPSSKIQSDHPTILELAKDITSGMTADYDKAKAVHDWVSSNIWYDYDELYSGIPSDKTAIETLVSQKGVCIDYALLTAALLRAAQIPAKLVTGYVLDTSENWSEELIASNKRNHVWNEVYVDDRWIIIDTSYDSNNTYKYKTFSTGTGIKNRKYFDITIEFLSTDRYIVENDFDPVTLG